MNKVKNKNGTKNGSKKAKKQKNKTLVRKGKFPTLTMTFFNKSRDMFLT